MTMPRVLVIEDEPDLRLLYATALREAGHEVVEAEDGLDGLKQMSADPALVILDLLMPRANGYEFLRRLRSSRRHRAVPVIVVSATPTGRRSLIHGADRYLAKPFDIDALTNIVRDVIRGGTALLE